MKIYINEKKMKNLLKEMIDFSPDIVYFNGNRLSFSDQNAFPFGFYGDKFIYGEYGSSHSTTLKNIIIDDLENDNMKYVEINDDNQAMSTKELLDKGYFTYDVIDDILGQYNKKATIEGRLWHSRSYKLLAFWTENPDENTILDCINELEYLVGEFSENNTYIANGNQVMLIMDYFKHIKTVDNNVNKERIIHNLPADEKRNSEQMKSAMNTVNKIKGEKFGEPNNNRSVPEVEYNFYKRYGMGESVDVKKVRQGIIPYEADSFTVGTKTPCSPSIQYGVGENMDLEVDANDVKLDSFKKEKQLNPKIWQNLSINPKLRLRLLDVADEFWDGLEVGWVKIKDIILTGSICNYNWSKYSDIDLHIIIDYNEVDGNVDFVKDYFNAKKNEWNEAHSELKMYGFPIEIYVQDINERHESSGVYSLEKNKWLIKPNPHNIKQIGLNKFKIKEKSAKIMTMIDDLYDLYENTKDKHQLEKLHGKVKLLLIKIKNMRKNSLKMDGENSTDNIIYKVMRRSGHLDKLYDLKINIYDRINTIG